ncbi:MAG TPA: BON domain-containing protein [Acidobacteriaceae bacterium]|nr:BON domain-containing protein [Acidobacteriaceae bacterium]
MIGKLRLSVFGLPLMAAVAVFVATGCSKKPTDAALATEVQKKIMADSTLTAQPISVAANNGTVTLSGTVGDQSMRDAAAKDASQVSDVRTVVNNLNVAAGANANEAPTNSEGAQGGSASAPPPPANAQASAAPPPAPQPIVVPAGTRIRVRLGQTLSTKENQTGDPFSGVVADSVRVNGQTVIPAGARARGVVTESKGLGKFKGQAVLAIRLDSISADGRTYQVRTSHVERVEQGKGKRSAVLTGGGAGLGALIGGLAGGGKGALIGGLVGGGGGAAGSAFTGNKDLVIPAESILTFDLERSLTVTP